VVKTPSTKTSPAKILEQTLWGTADKRRSKLEVGEYRHIVFGQVFPKHVSDTLPTSRHGVWPESSIKAAAIKWKDGRN
jgi:type I restriction-modification system DNA methylase subunit